MSVISAPGLGSGLDVQSIISALMDYERQPLTALKKKESEYQNQISAYGQLSSKIDSFKSAMAELDTIESFQLFKTTVGDETLFSATTDSTAAAGNYNIDVDRLAQRHKMASAEALNTATFGGADANDALDFTINGQSFSVNIYNGGAGMTMSEIRDAVNNATDNSGVTATVINGDGGNQKLVFTADEMGYDQRVQLSYSGSLGADPFSLSTLNKDSDGVTLLTPATLDKLDSQITVDGYTVTRSNNKISDVMQGVTLNLSKVGSSTLDVNRDDAGVTSAINNFIDSFNGVISKLRDLREGDLKNDSTLRTIESQMRSVLNNGVASGTYQYLSEVGVKTDKDTGQLTLNASTLTKAMDTDFAAVASLFGNTTDGVAKRLYDLAGDFLDTSGGLLDARTDGLNSRVRTIQDQQLRMSYRLEQIEKRYQNQFTALDGLMSQMNTTSSYLTQQLAALS